MSTQFAVDLVFGVKDQGLAQFEKKLTGLEKAVANIGGANAFGKLRASVDKTASSVDKVRAAADRIDKAIQAPTAGFDKMRASAEKVVPAVQKTGNIVQRLAESFKRLNDANLSRLQESMRKVRISARALKDQLGGLGGIAATIGAGALVRNFAQLGERSADSQRRLKFLTEEYGELGEAQKALNRIQKETGSSALDAREGFSGLYASLRPMGKSIDEIETAFVGFSKAASRSGATTQEMQSGLLQLKQALGSGVLQGDELRALGEGVPAIGQAIAGVLNVSVSEIKKLGSEGKITADVLLQALAKLEKGAAPSNSGIQELRRVWANFQEDIADSLGDVIGPLVNGFAALANVFDALPDPIRNTVVAVGALTVAFAGVVAGAGALSLALPALTAGFAVVSTAATAAWVAITGPVGLIVGGLLLITKAAYDLIPPFKQFVDTIPAVMAAFWNDLVYDAKNAIGIIKKEWEALVKSMIKGWEAFIKPLTDTFTQAANVLENAFESLGLNWQGFCNFAVQAWNSAVDTIIRTAFPLYNLLKPRVDAAVSTVQNQRKQVAATPFTRGSIEDYDKKSPMEAAASSSIPLPKAPDIPGSAGSSSGAAEKAVKAEENRNKQLHNNRLDLAEKAYQAEMGLIDFKYGIAKDLKKQQERIWELQQVGPARSLAAIINQLNEANRGINERMRELEAKRDQLKNQIGLAQQRQPLATANMSAGSSANLPPQVIEYYTGDPAMRGTPAYDPKGHGGKVHHEHAAFDSVENKERAVSALQARGITVGSQYRRGDPGWHGANRAIDVPAYPNFQNLGLPDNEQGEMALGRMFRETLRDTFGGGGMPDMSGAMANQNTIDGVKVGLEGVNKEIEHLKENAEKIQALNLEEAVLKSTSAIREQTKTLKDETELLDLRNTLMESGVTGDALDREMEHAKVLQTLTDYQELLNDAYKDGKLDLKQYTDLTEGLTKATDGLTEAQKKQYQEQVRLAGNDAGVQLKADQDALRERLMLLQGGRSELTAQEQLVKSLGDKWAGMSPGQKQRLLDLAAGVDLLKQQVEESERLDDLYKSIGGAIEDGIGDAITAVIDKSKTLQEVLSDILGQIGQMLIQFGLDSIFAGLGNQGGILGKLFGGERASGGPVTPDRAFLVGEEGPELFLPSSSGKIIPTDETAQYIGKGQDALGGASESLAASYYLQPGQAGRDGRTGQSPLPIPYVKNGEGRAISQEAAQATAEAFAGTPMDINYRSLRVGDLDVVSKSEAEAMAAMAARRGAEQGTSAALAALRNSVSTRRKAGL